MKKCWLAVIMSLLSGISWAQCANGNPGTSCNGPLSVQPQSGNNTQSAITLIDLAMPVLAPAAGQYTLSIASGMLVESDNGSSYHSLMGPQGLQGPTGSTGTQGTTGATGTAGPVGPQGTPGTAGPVGPPGAAGPQGTTGTAGTVGPVGPPGAPGPVGPQGTAGATGTVGPAGPPGTVGPGGPQGTAGAPGTTGATGPQGPAGTTGATGTAGATGTTGAVGPVGATGAVGPQGTPGLIGLPGAQGPQGTVGSAGPVGAQGPVGSQGTQGPQGPAGTTAAPSDYSFYYGTGYKAGVGAIEVAGSSDRDQIDMTNATSVRIVLTIAGAALPSGSYAQAEYTPDGTSWYPLSGEVPVTAPKGLYSSGWQGLSTGANGDFVVRIVVFNAGTAPAQIGLRQLHLQFK